MTAKSTYEPRSTTEVVEDDAALATVAVGDAARVAEVAGFGLVGLLTCPPLAILVAIVLVPLIITAVVVGLVVAVVTAPYLVVHHFRAGDRRHASLLKTRVRAVWRAAVDVLPHRIVADARKLGHMGR